MRYGRPTVTATATAIAETIKDLDNQANESLKGIAGAIVVAIAG